ncbi:MAG: methyltransferase domain-containing protein [Alphaproteobacteria bacterium]|nr:methyltransferase domain-containing protein [Alphaproteobacteria bacterium]
MMQLQDNHSLGTRLFILRALRNPRQLGAVAPSSRHLGALLARHATIDDSSPIVELGGGTGALTRALIKAGIAPSRIYVIELDSTLADYLKTALPHVNIIHGNATELNKILPPEILGKVPRIVSGLPMINMPEPIRRKILDSCFEIMTPGGAYIQYTYSPRSSIDAGAYQLTKKRLGTIFLNLPPATVWQYTKE